MSDSTGSWMPRSVRSFCATLIVSLIIFAAIPSLAFASATANLTIFSCSSGSSSAIDISGHSWLSLKNVSGKSIEVLGVWIRPNESMTLGTWGNKGHNTVWYNLEPYLTTVGGNFKGRVSLSEGLTGSEFVDLKSWISDHQTWTLTKNCAWFASRAWNHVSDNDVYAGVVCRPARLVISIKHHKGFNTDRAFGTWDKGLHDYFHDAALDGPDFAWATCVTPEAHGWSVRFTSHDDGKTRTLWDGFMRGGPRLSWSPDGNYLLAEADAGVGVRYILAHRFSDDADRSMSGLPGDYAEIAGWLDATHVLLRVAEQPRTSDYFDPYWVAYDMSNDTAATVDLGDASEAIASPDGGTVFTLSYRNSYSQDGIEWVNVVIEKHIGATNSVSAVRRISTSLQNATHQLAGASTGGTYLTIGTAARGASVWDTSTDAISLYVQPADFTAAWSSVGQKMALATWTNCTYSYVFPGATRTRAIEWQPMVELDWLPRQDRMSYVSGSGYNEDGKKWTLGVVNPDGSVRKTVKSAKGMTVAWRP